MKAIIPLLWLCALTVPADLLSQNFYNGKEIPANTDHFFVDPETGITYSQSPNLSNNERKSPSLLNTDTLFLTFFRNSSTFGLISDSGSYSYSSFTWTVQNTEGYWVVQPGVYFLWAQYSLHHPVNDSSQIHMIVYENVIVNSTTHFSVDSIAFNRIQTNAVDQNGTLLFELPGMTTDHLTVLFPVKQGFTFVGGDFYHFKQYYISDVSPAIKVLTGCFHQDFYDDHTIHLVENPLLHGVDSSITMTNNPSAFAQSHFNIPFSAIDKADVKFGAWNGLKYKFFSNGLPYYFLGGTMNNMGTDEEWSGMIYTDMTIDTLAGLTFKIVYELGSEYKLNSDLLDEIYDSVGFLETLKIYPGAVTVGSDDTINVGYGCRYYANWWNNNREEPMMIAGDNWTIGMMRELYFPKKNDQHYSLYDSSGSLVISGHGADFPLTPGTTGVYTGFIVDSSYMRGGYKGTYSTEFQFDLTRYNPNPPEIKMIRTTDENKLNVWNILPGDPLFVYFNAGGFRHYEENGGYREEYIPLIDDSTKLFVKDYYSTEWEEVAVIKLGEDSYMGAYYKTDLSAFTNLDSTALSLKVTVVDEYFNRNTTSIDPAIIIGDILTGSNDKNHLNREILVKSFPNPFNETVDFLLTDVNNIPPRIQIYDAQGKLIQTISEYRQIEQNIKFTWNGKDKAGNKMPMGVYLFTITIGKETFSGRVVKVN